VSCHDLHARVVKTITVVVAALLATICIVGVPSKEAHAKRYCGPDMPGNIKELAAKLAAMTDFNFNRACELHDKCYDEGGAKVAQYVAHRQGIGKSFESAIKDSKVATMIEQEQEACDRRFKANLQRACDRLWPVVDDYCKKVDVMIFHGAVKKHGHSHFVEAVRKHYRPA
jgi:hypothetical protein